MPAAKPTSRRDLLWQPRTFYLLVVLYYLFHAGLSLALPDRAGPAPGMVNPSYLYAGLTWIASGLFGPEGGMVALRYALAATLHAVIYGAAWRLTDDRKLAFFAGWAPILIYAVGWRLHGMAPQSVLVAVLVMSTARLGLALLVAPSRRITASLGVVGGLGLLAGGGYVIGLLSMMGAGLIGRDTRAAFTGGRVALIWVIALAIVLVQFGLVKGLGPFAGGSPVAGLLSLAGVDFISLLIRLARAALVAVLPFAVLFFLIFHKALNRVPRDAHDPGSGLLVRYLIGVATVLPVAVLALKFGIVPFTSLYALGDPTAALALLYPLLLPLILYLFWRVKRTGYSGTEWKWLLIVMAIVAASVVQLRLQQPFLDLG